MARSKFMDALDNLVRSTEKSMRRNPRRRPARRNMAVRMLPDGTIEADVTWLLSWDESPEAFNRWTTIRAARVFATRMLGDQTLTQYTAVDEQAALNELQKVEFDQAQPNSLTGGPGMVPVPTYSPELGLMRGVYGGVVQ